MTLVTALTIIAAVLGFVQAIPYIVSILRGITKPSRVAVIIWVLMDSVVFVGLVTVGWSGAAALRLGFVVTQIIVAFLLPKYGVGGKSKFDLICFGIGIIAVIGWIIIHQAFAHAHYGAIFAVVLTSGALAIGNLNLILKLIKVPLSEDITAWGMTLIAALLTTVTLKLTAAAWVGYVPTLLTAVVSATVIGIQIYQRHTMTRAKCPRDDSNVRPTL